MSNPGGLWLIAAGWMSAAAALLHIACIIGGPDWYRFFGAGEAFARAAERGSPVPAIMTMVIAAILAAWAAFAFGAAGITPRLPFSRAALVAIAFVLIARAAMAFVPAFWVPENRTLPFIITTSAICLVMGLCFAIGTWRAWPMLAVRP
jgi:hypothetical protein